MLKKQPKWLFFPADDQGASSAAIKSCHGDKNCLTTPLTTYGILKGELILDFEQWCQENTDIKKLSSKLSKKSSSPEQYVGFYLSKLFDDIEYQKQFDWLGGKSLDIYIPSLQLAIEYNELQHHAGREESDSSKFSLCKEHGENVFRIIAQDKNRPDRIPFKNVKNSFIYFHEKDYRDIEVAIQAILSYITKNHKRSLFLDIDLNRDKKEILSYIQKKYHQRSIANIWPEAADYWDSEKNAETVFDVLCTNRQTCYQLKCPYCGEIFKLDLRRHYERKSFIPHECEYQEIEESLQLAIKNYRECGHLIVFDNSLRSRRIYDEIISRIKYPEILSSASKEELELYKKLGFESSVLDNCLAQYADE